MFLNLRKGHKYFLVVIGFFMTINCLDSKAVVTHSLNYTTDEGDTGSLSGTITIDESNVTYGSNVNDGSGNLPTWITSLTLNWDPGAGPGSAATFNKSDFMAIRFVATDSSSVNFNSNLVPQFTQISFLGKTGNEPTGGAGFEMNYLGQEYQLTSTPGPLPLLGFGFLIRYKRKIKTLLNSSTHN